MASPIYKVFVAVGLLCILHAAYSAAQHRTYLRLTKTEFLALPLDIAIQVRELRSCAPYPLASRWKSFAIATTQKFLFFSQCLVSLGVVAFGVINVAGELKEIRVTAELEKQSFETVWNNPSFYSFNHRGKALFGEWRNSKFLLHHRGSHCYTFSSLMHCYDNNAWFPYGLYCHLILHFPFLRWH